VGRPRPLEETLEALRAVRRNPHAGTSIAELRGVIAREGSHAVARAAAIVGEHGLGALAADLVAAFPRFLEKPERADPGCSTKTAIVEALRRLDQPAVGLYRRGVAHVQMEPVFGGRIDTAVDLRSSAALGLAEHGGRDVLVDLAHLLADPEAPVRVSAARAVAVAGGDASIPLLHLKAVAGDAEARVVAECLLSLLRIDPAGQMSFVASLLDKGAAEAAASALGESRLADALPILRDWLPTAQRRGLARAALFAMAGLRRDEAVDLLLDVVRDEPAPVARDAIHALASIRTDAAMRERVHGAAGSRPELRDALARAFGGGA
jgi:HEAT repeat protein